MRGFAVLTFALLTVAGCHLPFRRAAGPMAPAGADSLYWKAVNHLDAANQRGSLDTAVLALDAYLAGGTTQPHRQEALVLRQLARDSRQLARVEGLLRLARTDSTPQRSNTGEAELRRRDEESVKEIQRLKEELAKANEELERIRKRLAAPKPPGTH
jgi:hypothetical protein